MLHRLPAGNRVVGNHERDDPGRVLGRGALVGERGLVDLGALDGPADRVAAEPAAARSVLVHLREYGAHHLDERPPAGKTCTTRLRRLGSLSARSRTLLMCRPTWCS